MDRELACEIVKDLLPLYVDGMVSDVSKESIEKHLEHCTDCDEIYQNMAFHLEKEAQTSEVGDVKRFLKKTKQMYFFYGLGGLSFISILVCIIVDLALNKGITWSFIPAGAVIFADVFGYVLAVCKKNKAYITMAVISIGIFCLLSVIQVTRYYLMNVGTVWVFRYGFPIMLLWLGILWIPVLSRTLLKWNIWDCIALFLLLVIAGNYITKLIIGDYVWNDVFRMRGFIGNALGEVIGIVVFGIIGRVKKWRK
ncbi:MAG: zf-HC2 domain-containing protein [Lachnospiraceae bacterium]|nr:zf-HC2 domain-containing protein [Lachnospiraceae bacterium]